MKIGFAGAGKVGTTLGKYFQIKGCQIAGYFSHSIESAKKASEFTSSKCYWNIDDLLVECDALFLTLPDKCIKEVYSALLKENLKGKLLCHCSGLLSCKDVFANAEKYGAFVCSVHPLFAISDKKKSYGEIADGFFTLEGCPMGVEMAGKLLEKCCNPYEIIDEKCKHKYHLSASIVSNLVVGLLDMGINLMTQCGFSRENALKALYPLVTNNAENVMKNDVVKSLTGPVQRGDYETVEKHLSCLSGEEREIYILLSKKILAIAKKKNISTDYSKTEELLREEKYEK